MWLNATAHVQVSAETGRKEDASLHPVHLQSRFKLTWQTTGQVWSPIFTLFSSVLVSSASWGKYLSLSVEYLTKFTSELLTSPACCLTVGFYKFLCWKQLEEKEVDESTNSKAERISPAARLYSKWKCKDVSRREFASAQVEKDLERNGGQAYQRQPELYDTTMTL